MDDSSALAARASQGDGQAVEALLERHLPGLRAFVRLRTGPDLRAKEASSDIVQSVCLEILQHLDRYRYPGDANFRHWLYATAWRKLSNRRKYYRSDKRDLGREARGGPAGDSDPEARLLGCYSGFATPSKAASAREQIERVEAAFARMPEEHREVILLAHVAGLPRAEIARQMNRSEGAVRVLLSRALAALAELLHEE